MLEVEVEQPEPVATAPQAPKRKRKPAVGAGEHVTTRGDYFVCNYTGRLVPSAVAIPGVRTAVFANVPCATAWLGANVKDVAVFNELASKLAEEYGQQLPLPCAPDRAMLGEFGGTLTYPEWMGALANWDRHTETAGFTLKQWNQRKRSGGASKRGKAERFTFEPGSYLIPVGATSRIRAIDSLEVGTKGALTPVSATQKVCKFVSSHRLPGTDDAPGKERYRTAHAEDKGVVIYCAVPLDPESAEPKQLNTVATALAGHHCYGPARLDTPRKLSTKI